jgi:hypothetical protein
VVPFESMKRLFRVPEARVVVEVLTNCLHSVRLPSFDVRRNSMGRVVNVQSLRNAFAHAEVMVSQEIAILSNSDNQGRVVLEFSCQAKELQSYLVALNEGFAECLTGSGK